MPANQTTVLKSEELADFLWDNRFIYQVFKKAASSFVKTEDGNTQIWAASRDWFLEEWGRDTFISVPGTLLVLGKFQEAKSLFQHFAQYERDGLIPNRISKDQTLYNTVDGSMWYLQALKKYVEYSNDWGLIEELFPTIQDIMCAYRDGTQYVRSGQTCYIYMDDDGLIVSPAQATWMDADPSGIGEQIVTPRNGKAVEINALWYANLLWFAHVMETLKKESKEIRDILSLSKKVRESFNENFWNDSEDCLLDVIEGDPHGGALRPNQIIAVSHGLDLLPDDRQLMVFDVVERDLLTIGGLRTLSPRDSYYRGVYNTFAPISEKDIVYHQGTVWPWLMGSFCDALVRVRKYQGIDPLLVRRELKELLTPLVRFCLESEWKTLPEVFSGDVPYHPGGTTSQAWSVSEVFRVLMEYHLIES